MAQSIKDLAFDMIHGTRGNIDDETITTIVRNKFPESKWKHSHSTWYKSQIKNGRLKDEFNE
mgnify:FL=1